MSEQAKTALSIQLRTEKNALSLMDKAFKGQTLETATAAFIEKKRATVTALEAKLKGR